MNTSGDLLRQRGILAAVLGAGVFLGAAGLYIYKEFILDRRRRQFAQELQSLHMSVSEIQQELLALKSRYAVPIRRKNSKGSLYSVRRSRRLSGNETDSDMFSTLDTDEDEEFFDFTSDDELGPEAPKISSNSQLISFDEIDKLLAGDELEKDKAFLILKELERKLDNEANFLWRLAKAYHSKSIMYGNLGNEDEKKNCIFQGLELAEKALHLDGSSADAHKWFAILIGLKGSYISTKEKIQNGQVFHKHVSEAMTLRPNDYSLHHLLGRFKYEIANLSWMEKKVAAAIGGELPPATLSDAADDFEKAEELCESPWLENRLLLAKCYLADKQYDKGISWLDKANKIHPRTNDERICQQEIEDLLKKYSSYR